MIRWILNADDLGFSPFTNDAIMNLAIHGKINAASMMVNNAFLRRRDSECGADSARF
ncbi:MAG: ChbG/HpnK family deacetylase [Planctomycetia bacterium]|nr:ChbG/HpnK family deacetylase [Planctomycetia bacterium]